MKLAIIDINNLEGREIELDADRLLDIAVDVNGVKYYITQDEKYGGIHIRCDRSINIIPHVSNCITVKGE